MIIDRWRCFVSPQFLSGGVGLKHIDTLALILTQACTHTHTHTYRETDRYR